MDTLFTQDEIKIHAPASTVWNTLTNPDLTPQYMFGCTVITNWKVGDSILWKGAEDGVLYVQGTIVAIDPEKNLSFTVFDPNANYTDIPSNYLTVNYTLETVGEDTLVKVTQGDYKKVEDGAKRYEDTMSQGGWSSVLEAIKKLAEKEDV